MKPGSVHKEDRTESPVSLKHPPRYRVGDAGPEGPKIKTIYGQSESVIVYRGDDGDLYYWKDAAELSDKDELALQYYDNLFSKMVDVLPRKKWDALLSDLGSALYNALAVGDSAKSIAAFSNAEARVNARTVGYSRFLYMISSLVTAAVLGIVSFVTTLVLSMYQTYALCLIFALAGSLASVILRSPTIEIGPYEQRWNVIVRGFFRILLGGLLAAFFIVACKANLILGGAATTNAGFFTFSFLSGFSERFVPDILAGFEERQKQRILRNLNANSRNSSSGGRRTHTLGAASQGG